MSVASHFDAMSYGPAPEGDSEARAWLARHGDGFGHFINGAFAPAASGETFETFEPATGKLLARLAKGGAADVDTAARAAREAQAPWAALSGHARARHLYALARLIQRHARLIAVIEALDNGKPIRETRDIDVPLAARHFYHHAGWAQIQSREFPGYQPVGVVGQIIPWNFPFLMLAWKVAPALALGNTVVLKPAEFTSLTALLFAELAAASGLPPGVLNIVTGEGDTGALIVEHPGIDKIAFTGSTEVGRLIREKTAGSGKSLTLELGGKSPFIVFDDADIDAAIEGVVDAIWFNQGQVCCAGSRLLLQEGIAEMFLARLRRRMDTLRVGHSLDKAIDMSAIVAPVQLQRIEKLVATGVAEGATIYQAAIDLPQGGCFMRPTLLSGVQPAATVAREEIFGPVVVSMTFRTPDEAVMLANNSRYGLAASVWSETIGLALDVAAKVQAGVVWVNATNLFDASSGFGGYRESGYGREGGREGVFEYLKPKAWAARPLRPATADQPQETSAEKPPHPPAYGGSPLPVVSLYGERQAFAFGERASGALGEARTHLRTDQPSPLAGEGGEVRQDRSRVRGLLQDSPQQHDATGGFSLPTLDRTAKLFIGGKQARPDGNYSRLVTSPEGRLLGEVGGGNRKDIRNAVEAARKAEGWSKASAHNRAQVLYYLAENLSARSAEFTQRIAAMTGAGHDVAEAEVAHSISRLFSAAADADKYEGRIHTPPLRGLALAVHEPMGVVGLVCPPEAPLLAFVSLLAPLIACGNRVVAVPSEPHPLTATDFYQVLETSDVPPGVVNIVTGSSSELLKTLAQHDDVDALWVFGAKALTATAERLSVGNLKRTLTDNGLATDWYDAASSEGEILLRHAVQVKNVWIPYGE